MATFNHATSTGVAIGPGTNQNVEPVKLAQVQNEMDRIHSALSIQEDLVVEIEKRFVSILRVPSAAVGTNGPEQKDAQMLVPMANDLRAFSERAMNVCEALKSILQRTEL